LLAEGFLTSRSGSGTHVAATAHPAPPGPAAPVRPAERLAIDFRPGRPDLAAFPRGDWMWAMREVSRTAPAEALGYGDARGSPELREILAGYLRRVRGAVVDPDQMVICTGFQQGVNLVLRALARAGVNVVALEEPGEVELTECRARWGLDGIPVGVDDHGIDVGELMRTRARAAVVTPAHQSPTGVVLSPPRRRALAEWAQARGATIVEDDYDAEFRYDREPVGALQGLAPAHVALLGTVSKSLAPAVRLGWIVCPSGLLEPVAAAKALEDRGSPGLDQLALARLIESGRYDKHLRRMRGVYAGKRRALIEALAAHAPEVELRGLAAGFHAAVRLPDGSDAAAIAEAARARSVGLHPIAPGSHTRPPELVIGFGDLSEQAIRRGIATVADLLRGD
jgi:GntR family transcriptional regulator/MocR family aminotransferase